MSRSRILIITYPRTASNLLMRMLSLPDQPNALAAESGGYFFMPAIRHMREANLVGRPIEQWTEHEREKFDHVYQLCFENLQHLVLSAQEAQKKAVVKEHAPFMIDPTAQSKYLHGRANGSKLATWKVRSPDIYNNEDLPELPTNESALPEGFLARWFPTFLIRHPALAFPSYYRVMLSFQGGDLEKMGEVECQLDEALTLRWTRMLYDWYMALWQGSVSETGSPKPVVLDADDILTNPDLVCHYCALVGLDSSKVRFAWDKTGESELGNVNPVQLRTRDTLFASSGIVQGKTFKGLTLDGEVSKWKTEFGEIEGGKLEKWVRDAMPDYEYLWGERLACVEEKQN